MIELDGAIVVAFHLRLVSVLQDFPRPREGLHAHRHIVSTPFCPGQKYESPGRAGEQPVLCDGPGVEIRAANGENGRSEWESIPGGDIWKKEGAA